MNRQSWTQQEDEAITHSVSIHGFNDWTRIASELRCQFGDLKRTGKQCRQRWYNHLSPTVSKLPWTALQEESLFKLHRSLGNRWKDISKSFPGRTDNDIKNHFYSTLRRSLRRLNKALGKRNSTTQMREIKPSVLSSIMRYVYEHAGNSPVPESLQDLPTILFNFASSKPSKSTRFEDRKDVGEIFALISCFSEQYSQSKSSKERKEYPKQRNVIISRKAAYTSNDSVHSDEGETQHKSQQHLEQFSSQSFIDEPQLEDVQSFSHSDEIVEKRVSQISLDEADSEVEWIDFQEPSRMSAGGFQVQENQGPTDFKAFLVEDFLGWEKAES